MTYRDLQLIVLGGLYNGNANSAYRLNENDFSTGAMRDLFLLLKSKMESGEPISVNDVIDGSVYTNSALVIEATDKFNDDRNLLEDFDKRIEELIACSDILFVKDACQKLVDKIDAKQIKNTSALVSELALIEDCLATRHVEKTDATLGESIIRAFKEIAKRRWIKRVGFGLKKLDESIGGGIARGEYVLIAARTNVGKSIMAMLPALEAGAHGESVLYCTNEMTKEQMSVRMLANRSGTSIGVIEGSITGTSVDYQALADAQKVLSAQDIVMLPNCYKLSQIEECLVRRKQLGRPYSLVIIDMIGKLQPDVKSKSKSRYDELTDISARAFQLCKQYDCTIIGMVQINREGALANKVSLEHLKGSGSFEEDADKVFLMWGDKEDESLRHINLAKNRTGKKDMEITLRMVGDRMRFYEV